jgi:hypothetical protein
MYSVEDGSFLVEDIGDPVREHSIRCGEHIERLTQQDDFSTDCRAVTEEALMDEAAGDP